MSEVTGPYEPGTPCWIDLMVPDQQAGLDFYRDLFGWQGEIGPEEYGGYSICTQKGKPVAGMMRAMAMGDQPTPPTAWTTYFSVADADAAEAAVRANGGTVIMPTSDVMKLGRMFVAADPFGDVLVCVQPDDDVERLGPTAGARGSRLAAGGQQCSGQGDGQEGDEPAHGRRLRLVGNGCQFRCAGSVGRRTIGRLAAS